MATAPKTQWYKIAESITEIHFEKNGLSLVNIDGREITLAIHNNKIFACTQKCPHAGGALTDGYIDALGNIVCPLHCYKFNLQNGYNVSGEGYYLKTFKVEQREDGLFILF
ncbi:MAG TPA: Rieske 2Fe-2S domain-containing protein [Ferruginibacter sp.]|nr:Rieske 2Fe-2S domain-containing protein [Ferruginibacter sp.]